MYHIFLERVDCGLVGTSNMKPNDMLIIIHTVLIEMIEVDIFTYVHVCMYFA